MNSYEEKIEARRERLEARAERLSSESDAVYKRARVMASVIPFGQPVHGVRDRNYRDRIHNTYGRAFKLDSEAKAAAARAASVGTGGISSDDPDAIAKLRVELAEAKAKQVGMVAANKIVRAFYKAGVRDAASGDLWPRYVEKLGVALPGISEGAARKLLAPDFCGRIGFPDYATKNNGANVRRIEARIAELERERPAADDAGEDYTWPVGVPDGMNNASLPNATVVELKSENRIAVIFPGKPSEAIRSIMKSSGFRWSPRLGAWVRMLNSAGRCTARYAVEKIASVGKVSA
jgi:hypothetical protein